MTNATQPARAGEKLTKVRLTESQRGWLEVLAEQPGGMLSRMTIQVGQGGSISSLVNRGLAEWTSPSRALLRITDAGRAALTHGGGRE